MPAPNHPTGNPPNRLARESSPYLLQHAHNPVDWYPWGEEAFTKARAENKPLLLSIGYSACHWCHVMAHESFEDEETAELMNCLFINVKLDREERPDIDKIYQTSQSLLTQRSGGWPLTMFLDPHEHCPFFGGTYFPKEPRHNLPPFKLILQRVIDYYNEHYDDILSQNERLKSTLQNIYAPAEHTAAPPSTLPERARAALLKQFDPVHGGFGDEPKFPHTELMQFMLDQSRRGGSGEHDPQAEYSALLTLEKMCLGGLYDHLGGGFYRYSVDAAWQIPHFEKMLYDNGALLGLLAEASHLNSNPRFSQAADETAQWIKREMQSPEGGYYATLDADTAGGEGAFYAWEKEQFLETLSPQDADIAARHFGLNKVPNFEGKWHLHVAAGTEEIAKTCDRDVASVQASIECAKRALFTRREQRPRPGRDDKIITGWNALVIKGMAQTARLLVADDNYASARAALDFIRTQLWRKRRLMATYKDSRAYLSAYLDDYAFLLDAVLHMLQYRWRNDDLTFALQLADAILELFEDPERGGYYFTAHDHEQLLQRPRTLHDEATPSGYGVATLALMRCGLLCGNERYRESADRALLQAAAVMSNTPHVCTTLLRALREQHEPTEIIIIRAKNDDTLARWQALVVRHHTVGRLCFAIPAGRDADLPEALCAKPLRGEACAYICHGTSCLAPVESLDQLSAVLADDR